MTEAPEALSVLRAGAGILAPVLSAGGFVFDIIGTGHGSGGGYASGRFSRSGQFLEFHVRHSLGLVSYGWDGQVISHQDYLRGIRAAGAYPGYGGDVLDAFRRLAADLAGPLSGFRDGDRAGYELGLRAAKHQSRGRLP